MMKKNKRADVPVMILVIGVFIICALVLLNFTFVKGKSERSFFFLNAIEEVNVDVDTLHFFQERGLHPLQISDEGLLQSLTTDKSGWIIEREFLGQHYNYGGDKKYVRVKYFLSPKTAPIIDPGIALG